MFSAPKSYLTTADGWPQSAYDDNWVKFDQD